MHPNRQFGADDNKQPPGIRDFASSIWSMEAGGIFPDISHSEKHETIKANPSSILRVMAARMYTHVAASDLGFTRN
jgi:tyrosine-protein phosphatase YwqE